MLESQLKELMSQPEENKAQWDLLPHDSNELSAL
jgi:hypothetical protein